MVKLKIFSGKRVSILVLLEIGLGELYRNWYRKIYLVSILVLLEIGLGAGRIQLTGKTSACFNPCFVGNRSGRIMDVSQAKTRFLFQSLFCWKSVWEPRVYGAGAKVPGFQSLFCWKSVWEIMRFIRFRFGLWCFNPCFVGNRSGSDNSRFRLSSWLLFQSLFCWKSVWEQQGNFYWWSSGWFQSLFCWKSVWENCVGIHNIESIYVSILVLLEIGLGGISQHIFNFFQPLFQSLFCWKSVWERNRTPVCHRQRQFQSLFCWKSVWEWAGRYYRPRSNNVSILVLLEIGLGDGQPVFFY